MDKDYSSFTTGSTSYGSMESVVKSDKSRVNVSKVDLKPFPSIKAKIDCFKFECHHEDLLPPAVAKLRLHLKGTVEVPKDRRNIKEPGKAWLAIHDPSLQDMRYLVERFWNARMLYIEFAVDFHLPPGSNELHLLTELKAQLRHCLFPQQYVRLSGCKRKFYSEPHQRYKLDGLGTEMPETQIIWEQLFGADKLALYIKDRDGHQLIGQPFVRLEARLDGSSCARMGLFKLGMLPAAAPNLRTYLTPMMLVGCGFKNAKALRGPGVPVDPWFTYGAQWPGSGKAQIKPDVEVHNAIGSALNDLRKSYMTVKPPSAVRHDYEDWIYRSSP